ncbi:DUF3325 domain-containing protein [Sphingobium lactosutens]|uniref:DUF3325 family protein n=1 Tax=Sphingobium lactosutens TaxID=522773 RepID=UPI0015B84BFD|nr:DUF3325 family protein [Sphingobium lactosutens]NWK97810.1 DUF3325 domain-containing protein [Sphingobium lactosutens]
MSLETGLISYAALVSLALAVKKHRPAPPLPAMPSPRTARLIGWLLLAAALIVAIWRVGPSQGLVAWIWQMCVAGALFVLLQSWRSRLALTLAVPSLLLAPLLMMIGA